MTFCVMQQLRMRLAEQDYVPLIRKLQGGGYRPAFLQDDGKVRGKVRAAARFRINDFLAWAITCMWTISSAMPSPAHRVTAPPC
jgi:hypothetical protein